MEKYVIIVAGGTGVRMGSKIPKQFMMLDDRPVLMHSICAFADAGIRNIIVAIPIAFKDYWMELSDTYSCVPHTIVDGGLFRSQSVKNGLLAINGSEALVAVHDGVRPFISTELISQAYEIAESTGSAVPYMDLRDSLRQIEGNDNISVERDRYKIVQTPQVFTLSILKRAYSNREFPSYTDDATMVDQLKVPITLFKGMEENIKITTPLDMLMAESILKLKKQIAG